MTELQWKSLEKYAVVLVSLEEDTQDQQMAALAKELEQQGIRTTIVCLNHTSEMILENFRDAELKEDNFVFVDTLSPFGDNDSAGHAQYSAEPVHLKNLIETIRKACAVHKCSVLIVDSLSSLLSFQERHNVVWFTNELKKIIRDKVTEKLVLFAILKDSFPEEEGRKLFFDLEMFVDQTVALAKD